MVEKKKVDLTLVMIGFALSYLFFGLNQIMDLFPEYTKHATGIAALGIFIVFIWLAYKYRPKDQKTKNRL